MKKQVFTTVMLSLILASALADSLCKDCEEVVGKLGKHLVKPEEIEKEKALFKSKLCVTEQVKISTLKIIISCVAYSSRHRRALSK